MGSERLFVWLQSKQAVGHSAIGWDLPNTLKNALASEHQGRAGRRVSGAKVWIIRGLRGDPSSRMATASVAILVHDSPVRSAKELP